MLLGISAIITASESFNDLKKKYNYGVIIKKFEEIKNTLEQLELEEDEMVLETSRLYKKVLDPKIYIESYMKNFN